MGFADLMLPHYTMFGEKGSGYRSEHGHLGVSSVHSPFFPRPVTRAGSLLLCQAHVSMT